MEKPWQNLSEYWTDGSGLTFNNWSPVSGKTGCGVVTVITGDWYKVECADLIYKHICKRPLKATGDFIQLNFNRSYKKCFNLNILVWKVRSSDYARVVFWQRY